MTVQSPDALIQRLEALPQGSRHIVALAGPPAAGKSTLAEHCVARLNAAAPGRAALVAMDGFHYDDGVLRARGRLARKGAPDTFDVGGLRALLARLRDNTEAEVAVPVFDRDIEISRAGAALVPKTAEVLVVEGNYLLLEAQPWDSLRPFFDLTALIRVPEDVLRARLTDRWSHHGLSTSAAAQKITENDLPNALTVLRDSGSCDLEIDGMRAASTY